MGGGPEGTPSPPFPSPWRYGICRIVGGRRRGGREGDLWARWSATAPYPTPTQHPTMHPTLNTPPPTQPPTPHPTPSRYSRRCRRCPTPDTICKSDILPRDSPECPGIAVFLSIGFVAMPACRRTLLVTCSVVSHCCLQHVVSSLHLRAWGCVGLLRKSRHIPPVPPPPPIPPLSSPHLATKTIHSSPIRKPIPHLPKPSSCHHLVVGSVGAGAFRQAKFPHNLSSELAVVVSGVRPVALCTIFSLYFFKTPVGTRSIF
jgi:hypothetical protein